MRFMGERGTARLAQLHALSPHVHTARPALEESWLRSAQHQVDLGVIAAEFIGVTAGRPALESCAARLLAASGPVAGTYAVLVVDASGVVRLRRDGDPGLAALLDALSISPGHDVGERLVGTTAAALALTGAAATVVAGHEHYHPQLAAIDEAAAPMVDANSGESLGAVAIVAPTGSPTDILLAHARQLAQDLGTAVAREPSRRMRAAFEHFVERSATHPGWVVTTDGANVFTGGAAAALEPRDLRVLTDSAVGSLALREFAESEVDLPSGIVADIHLDAVLLDGEVIGATVSALPCQAASSRQAEALRRQGAHVASNPRRDYAHGLRTSGSGRTVDSGALHAGEGIRDTRDLLTPYLRARHDVATSIGSHRNHVVIGEAGVGKHSLVFGEFRARHPQGRILTADCGDFTGDALQFRSVSGELFHGTLDDDPHLVVVGGLETLSPVAARRLDEILRRGAAGTTGPLLVASINETTIDLSRPYGLVMHYFTETIRVPPLRLRIDDIGDLAVEILGRLAGGRSLRLSYQAIRILEGYWWPGNVSELEDVLRYVISRKPVGEVQARDLPAVCFQGSSRRLSMLESAQRDAIIQALYESKGNRYRAAAALGIARSSLYRKIDSFGISYIA
jgi:transcriptional regulator of acetoin/glycerol metabolism